MHPRPVPSGWLAYIIYLYRNIDDAHKIVDQILIIWTIITKPNISYHICTLFVFEQQTIRQILIYCGRVSKFFISTIIQQSTQIWKCLLVNLDSSQIFVIST